MKTFIGAIAAGISIAIGAIIYLNIGGIAGAIFFAIGLLLIMQFDFNLYTGKVSYLTSYKQILYILIILLGNVIGTSIMYLFANPAAMPIVIQKLSTPAYITWIEAILCNCLIYFSVESYKETKNPLLLIAGVAGFILAGFEHSIASMCFLFSAHATLPEMLNYLTIVILGNAVGGILTHQIRTRLRK